MQSFFSALFEYNRHTNQQLIGVTATVPTEQADACQRLICHILNAHEIWNQRILGRPLKSGVWQLHSSEAQQLINELNYRETQQILQHHSIQELVGYSNTRGENFENTTGEILFHIINHSTHHRAQLVTLLKQAGCEVPATDFIFYKR